MQVELPEECKVGNTVSVDRIVQIARFGKKRNSPIQYRVPRCATISGAELFEDIAEGDPH